MENSTDIYQNTELFQWIIYVNSILTVAINALLTYVVYLYSGPEIGTYKYLMMVYSTYGVAYGLCYIIVEPGLFCWGNSLGMFAMSFLRNSSMLAQSVSCLIPGTYSGLIYLLMVHFIYRYSVLARRDLMIWFAFPHAWVWIITFFVYTANFWAVIYVGYHTSEVHYDYVKDFFRQTYNINVYSVKVMIHRYYEESPEGISLNYYDIFAVVNIAFLDQIVLIAIAFIFPKLVRALRSLDILMSKRTRSLQIQFFRSLALQTFIPVITGFVPVGFFYFCPIFGITLGIYSNIFVVLLSFHMLLNGITFLIVVSDYRKGISKLAMKIVGMEVTEVEHLNNISMMILGARNNSKNLIGVI